MRSFVRVLGAISLSTILVAGMEAQSGPTKGHLVIVGGGGMGEDIVNRFMELAGGENARIVVIPTAGGAESYDQDYGGKNVWVRAGASEVTVLHTYDRSQADTRQFAAPIRTATAVWFPGGRQWRLADSYLDTEVHRALWELLERGGVIGGSSAGATIQGSYLARGDTGGNTVMMGDHEVGLGFVKDVAIDQHLLRRNRQFDLVEIVTAKPNLLGIGIDESTAIVVTGDTFEVIGRGYVAIYDAQRKIDSGGDFYFLAPGDRYNLATREGVRPGRNGNEQPIERVVRRAGGN